MTTFNTKLELQDYEVSVEIEAHVEDFGIGPYEYWGSKGNDVQLGYELDKVNILEVKTFDEDGEPIVVTDPSVIKGIDDSNELDDAVMNFLENQDINDD